MSYTVVEFTTTQLPLVAIYKDAGDYVASVVVGQMLFRDPDDKGGANYVVPATADDFTVYQRHEYKTLTQLNTILPLEVVHSPRLYKQVSVASEANGNVTRVVRSDNYGWVVA